MFKSNIESLQENLSLKPSHLETSIDYPQIFTLPYSKSFANAYGKAIDINAEVKNDQNILNKVSDKRCRYHRIIKVDTRVLRWYKQYEAIQSYIYNLTFEYNQSLDDLKVTRAALYKSSMEERRNKTETFTKLQKNYEDAIKQSFQLKNDISKLKDAKKMLMREIQTNGYLPKEKTINDADPLIGDKILEIYRKKSEFQQYLIEGVNSYYYGNDDVGEDNWKKMQKEVYDIFLELKPSQEIINNYAAELKDINDKVENEIKINTLIEKLLFNSNFSKNTFKKNIFDTVWTTWDKWKKSDLNCPDTEIIDYIFKNNKFIADLKSKGIHVKSDQLIQLLSLAGKVYHCKDSCLEVEEHYIHKLRLSFLKKWNEPRIYLPFLEEFEDKPVSPDHDPILEAFEIVNQQQKKSEARSVKDSDARKINHTYTISQFHLTPSGFYNQDGQPLKSFMNLQSDELSNKIIMLPFFDKNGIYSDEVLQIVIGPKKPGKYLEPMPPVVKFVENQVINVSWQGVSLGEIRHSINLLPGESKKIFIEHKNKLSQAVSREDKKDSDNRQNYTSSFDENLQNELSISSSVSQSDQTINKSSKSTSQLNKSGSESLNESSQQDNSSSNFSYEVGVKASASFLFASGEVSSRIGGGSSSSSQRSAHNRSSQNSSREDALSTSLSNEGQEMNKQSRDVAAKNIQNTIRRVATDTSLENKVAMISTTKEQSKKSSTSVEESVITNENVGRTANYNFFQVQNLYRTSIFLKDTKIVLKTGFELVEGTGIDDIRVFELEEFNNIYQKIDQTYMSAILSAAIAYKVIKQYTDLLDEEPKNNKFLKLSDTYWKNGDKDNIKKLQALFKALKPSRKTHVEKSELERLLQELKKLSFSFNEKVLISESFHTVNTPALYSDSQLGLKPSTEPYIEKRRDSELESQVNKNLQQKAEIEFQHAQTEYLKMLTTERIYYPTYFKPKSKGDSSSKDQLCEDERDRDNDKKCG